MEGATWRAEGCHGNSGVGVTRDGVRGEVTVVWSEDNEVTGGSKQMVVLTTGLTIHRN